MKNIWLLLGFLVTIAFSQESGISGHRCGECHEQIFAQWKASRHGNSSAETDPLFKAMLDWANRDTNGRLGKKCLVCHSPLQTAVSKATGQISDRIACQACHGAKTISGHTSAENILLDFNIIYSDQPAAENEAHPVAHRDHFKSGEICLPCHAQMQNKSKILVCATGSEWQTYLNVTGKTCPDCHMPSDGGTASHLFPGSFTGDLLSSAAHLWVDYNRSLRRVRIVIENTGAGHALPTGTPLRMVILKVKALNHQDETVWENWKENPIIEDRTALFMKILGDAAGNGPVPPWRATRVLFERLLMPGIPDTVEYSLPNIPFHKIETVLAYRHAPAPLLKKLQLGYTEFNRLKQIARKTVELE